MLKSFRRLCLGGQCVVRTEGAGEGGRLSVIVKGRTSQPTAVVTRRQTGVAPPAGRGGDYEVSFTPVETGPHSITVLFNELFVTGNLVMYLAHRYDDRRRNRRCQ